MNYYIEGCAAKADKIRAAFEKLGYDVTDFDMCNDHILFFTYELQGGGQAISTTNANLYTANIIKTHPDYKELELPVVQKFKVGDWIHQHRVGIFKIIEICESWYEVIDKFDRHYSISFEEEKNCTLWSIADAKDGDVLVCYSEVKGNPIEQVGIFFGKYAGRSNGFLAHTGIDWNGNIIINGYMSSTDIRPATKERRELLFQKMREAGYQWDAEKKELKKIQPHYDIANFHEGMPVLVRPQNDCSWEYSVFSRITGNEYWKFSVCNGVSFTQCIPFNEETKHLLGTTDMPSEEYINW